MNELAIEARGLSKDFGGLRAVSSLDLDVPLSPVATRRPVRMSKAWPD